MQIFLLFSFSYFLLKMNPLVYTFTADVSLGRFDKNSMPQQTLIEMLVQDFIDVKIAKDEEGNFHDIEKWCIFKFNADGEVAEINIDVDDKEMGFYLIYNNDFIRSIKTGCFSEGGTIDFQYVPSTVTSLIICEMEFEGTLETKDLPAGLLKLSLTENKFAGTFSISDLPSKIDYVSIRSNHFEGSLDIESLPGSVTVFVASQNHFLGTINLNNLPRALRSLVLSDNELTGSLELRNAPITLEEVSLFGNNFQGEKLIVDASRKFKYFVVDSIFKGKVVTADGSPFNDGVIFDGEEESDLLSSDEDMGLFD